MKKTNRALTVAAIVMAMFMSAMEATVVGTAMPTVVADLHGLDLYGWVSAIYMLAATVTIPLWGKLSDLRGRKPVMLAGLALFLLGSVTSGMSATMAQLVLFRALQGIGAGALQPTPITIVGDIFTMEERGKVQAFFGSVWGLSAMVGPLLGGVIVHLLSWRWVFYINIPFGLISGLILTASFHEARREAAAKTSLDLLGAALLTVSVLALLLGAGGTHAWFTLPLSALALVAFVGQERRAPEPIAPLSLLGRPVIALSSLAGLLAGAVMAGAGTYLPLYAQSLLGATPTQAGSVIAPMLLGWPLASAVAGRSIPRVGYRVLVRGGMALVGVSSVMVWVTLTRAPSMNLLRAVMFVYGVGMGFANTALIIATQESVSWSQRGVATATTMFSRSIGGAVAVGALGAMLAQRLADKVPERVLRELVGPEHGRSLGAETLARMSSVLDAGMQSVFFVVAVCGVLAAVVGMMFPDVAVRRAGEGRTSLVT